MFYSSEVPFFFLLLLIEYKLYFIARNRCRETMKTAASTSGSTRASSPPRAIWRWRVPSWTIRTSRKRGALLPMASRVLFTFQSCHKKWCVCVVVGSLHSRHVSSYVAALLCPKPRYKGTSRLHILCPLSLLLSSDDERDVTLVGIDKLGEERKGPDLLSIFRLGHFGRFFFCVFFDWCRCCCSAAHRDREKENTPLITAPLLYGEAVTYLVCAPEERAWGPVQKKMSCS